MAIDRIGVGQLTFLVRALSIMAALLAGWLPVSCLGQSPMQSRATSLESANAVESFSRSLDYLKKALADQASRIEEQIVAIDKSGATEIQKGLIKEVKLVIRSFADQVSVTINSSTQACEFISDNIDRLNGSKEISGPELGKIVGLWMRLRDECLEARTRLSAARGELETLFQTIQGQEIVFKEYLQLKASTEAAKIAQQLVGETRNTLSKIRDDIYKTKLPGIS